MLDTIKGFVSHIWTIFAAFVASTAGLATMPEEDFEGAQRSLEFSRKVALEMTEYVDKSGALRDAFNRKPRAFGKLDQFLSLLNDHLDFGGAIGRYRSPKERKRAVEAVLKMQERSLHFEALAAEQRQKIHNLKSDVLRLSERVKDLESSADDKRAA